MDTVSTRVDESTHEQIQELRDDCDSAESKADAVEIAVQTGLNELGYDDSGQAPKTGLRKITQQAYQGSVWAIILLIGMTWLGPLESRLLVVGLVPIPAALWGLDQLLARLEPSVSQAISKTVQGDLR